jgi:hypothetical protein
MGIWTRAARLLSDVRSVGWLFPSSWSARKAKVALLLPEPSPGSEAADSFRARAAY